MATSALRIAEGNRQDTLAPELGLGAAHRCSVLAGLPAGSVWQADRIAHHAGAVRPTGFSALDDELPGGGWPAGALIELLLERPGVGELSMLLPVLARSLPDQWIVWLAPPLQPYAPALVRAGVPLARLLIVRPEDPQTLLWATRQATVSGSCATVLAWVPRIDNTGLRRLQLAAEESATPLFLFRPSAVAGQSSPAPLRLALAARGDLLEVRILKRRGPPASRPILLEVHAAEGTPADAETPPRKNARMR
jgi:protein ImuA